MKSRHKRVPETQFAIAPGAPEPVVEAYSNFVRVADEFTEAQDHVRETEAFAKVQVAQAHKQAAESRVTGSAPPKVGPAELQAKFDVELIQVKANVEVLWTATDEAGNVLAKAIGEHRDEWMAGLQETEAVAVERLRSALAEVRAAIRIVGAARRGPEWLSAYSVRDAVIGEQTQFAGADVKVDVARIQKEKGVRFDSFTSPEALLTCLEAIADPPPPVQTTRKGSWAGPKS